MVAVGLVTAALVAPVVPVTASASSPAQRAGTERVTASSWGGVLQGAADAYRYAWLCEKNQQQGRSCFDVSVYDRFDEVRRDVADLAAQMDRQQASTEKAINAVIKEIRDQDVRTAFLAVQKKITLINIANLKYQQYNNCMAHVSDPDVPCELSDMNGNPVRVPQYENPKSVADLYKDLGSGANGGPVARFLYSTLDTFAKGSGDLGGGLRDTGLELQQGIGGSKGVVQTGLLYALFQQLNAQVTADQNGSAGSRPTFVVGEYLTAMNQHTKYFVDLQSTYFTTVVAALQLKERNRDLVGAAEALTQQAKLGVYKEKNLALDQQMTDFSFPLSRAPQSDQAWFMPGDGNVYLLDRENRSGTSADYSYDFPSYSTLAMLSAALGRNNVKMSRLQNIYPGVIPGGRNAAWWANFGGQVKQFQTRTWMLDEDPPRAKNRSHFSGSAAPDYGVWGDNVAQRYDYSCVIPVRMWDGKPSMDDVWNQDFYPTWMRFYRLDWSKTYFQATKRGDGSKHFKVEPNPESTFNAVVRTGAVPAYDLTVGYDKEFWSSERAIRQGVGTFYRCAGWHDEEYTRAIDTHYMSISKTRADGLFERLSGKLTVFPTCKALRTFQWRGVGRPGAKDAVMGRAQRERAGYALKSDQFRRDHPWYRKNRALDHDRDGIACELTQGRTFPQASTMPDGPNVGGKR